LTWGFTMITVLVSSDSRYEVNRDFIRSAVTSALAKNRIKSGRVEVGVSIVGDRKMQELNKTYREIDETTDVLSFPLEDVSPITAASIKKLPGFVRPLDKILRLGDVVISYPQAVLEASEEEVSVESKLTDLLEHGVEHLLGIHHD